MNLMLNEKSMHLNQLQDALSEQHKNNFSVKNKIYLIDPLRNLVMYYPSDVNPIDVLKKMHRVLEVAQLG